MKKVVLCMVILVGVAHPAAGELELEPPRIGVGAAILLNTLPGFGLGSLLQGDVVGILQIPLDVLGWSCALESYDLATAHRNHFMAAFLSDFLLGSAGVFLFFGRFMGVLRPIEYVTKRRQSFKREIAFGVFPTAQLYSCRAEACLGLRLKLEFVLR